MYHSRQINELLESYRPGVDDLNDEPWTDLRTALAADPTLLSASQQHDHVVRTAMHEVAIPAGLSDRLLSALAVHESTSAPVISEMSAAVESPAPAQPPTPRITRRSLAFGFGAALVAGAAALLIAVWSPGGGDAETVSAEDLARQVQDWISRADLPDANAWLPATDADVLSTHPLDRDVLRVQVGRFQRLTTNEEKSLVVYELALGGRRARLFVSPTSRNYLVSLTPCTALKDLTGGRAAGAWQRDGFLYVLVYDDRDASFQDFVRVPNFT